APARRRTARSSREAPGTCSGGRRSRRRARARWPRSRRAAPRGWAEPGLLAAVRRRASGDPVRVGSGSGRGGHQERCGVSPVGRHELRKNTTAGRSGSAPSFEGAIWLGWGSPPEGAAMAETRDPQETDDPQQPEAVVAPVSAGEHLGAQPVVPEVDEGEVVDDVERPVLVEPTTVEPVASEPAPAEPIAPVATPIPPAAPAGPTAPDTSGREVVYVQAPTPPAARGNRGFGVLISLLG